MSQDKQLKKLTELIQKLVDNPNTGATGATGAMGATGATGATGGMVSPVVTVDHDLLQKLDVKVDQIQADVTLLKQQGNSYVTQADHKVVCSIQNDHETRLRIVELNLTRVLTWGTMGIVILGILEFIVQKFV